MSSLFYLKSGLLERSKRQNLLFPKLAAICIRDFGFIGEKLGEFRYPPYTDYNKRSAMFLLKRRNFRIPTGISAISIVFGVVCLAAAVGVVMSQCT